MKWDARMSLASRIKLLRTVAGETQEELAVFLHISRSCLASYETGRREPDSSILCGIAKHYGVSEAYLLGQVPIGTAYAVSGGKRDLWELMPPDGILDISNASPNGQIALIEFYRFLKARASGDS